MEVLVRMAGPDQKTPESPVERIAELVRRLCISLSNVTMYAPDHPVARKSIDEAYRQLRLVIESKNKPIIISSAEGRILFEGLPIEEANPLVARLARFMDELHVSNIQFAPEITAEEFHAFHRILAEGTGSINERGGLSECLRKAGISHITTPTASYVLITEDEKVVSRKAKVVEGEKIAEDEAEEELARYMVQQVLRQAREKKWMLEEIKNRPQKVAQRILDGIELATSRAELGKDAGDSIDILMQNIRMIGEAIAEESGGEEAPAEDVEAAVITLEKELRSRSQQLMSSKVAAGFINEILGIVTSLGDQIRARRVTSEIIKGQTGLKAAEKLLRKMASDDSRREQLLAAVRDAAIKQGLGEKDLNQLISRIKKQRRPSRQAPRRKTFDQALADGIRQRLKKLSIGDEQLTPAVESLATFLQNRMQEREKMWASIVAGIGAILESSGVPAVVWDYDGRLRLVTAAARNILGTSSGRVSPEFMTVAGDLQPPLSDLPQHPGDKEWSSLETALLRAAASLIKAPKGAVVGLLLRPPQ